MQDKENGKKYLEMWLQNLLLRCHLVVVKYMPYAIVKYMLYIP